jgi:hypothetical protein
MLSLAGVMISLLAASPDSPSSSASCVANVWRLSLRLDPIDRQLPVLREEMSLCLEQAPQTSRDSLASTIELLMGVLSVESDCRGEATRASLHCKAKKSEGVSCDAERAAAEKACVQTDRRESANRKLESLLGKRNVK